MPAAMDALPELAGDAKLLLAASSTSWAVPLELKLLGALVLLLLFLLFLIVVVWDRYGREISELYTGAGSRDGAAADSNVNAVADEYTVYQKLPTFFYEYMPRSRPKKAE